MSGEPMSDRDRLEQLQGLVARLERMPASAERDWMLREVRARAVDVETGVQPDVLRVLPRYETDAETVAPPSGPDPVPVRRFKRPRGQESRCKPMPVQR